MKLSVAETVRLAGGTMQVGAAPQAPTPPGPEPVSDDLKAEIAELKRRIAVL
jgi:hypothetical protein